MVGLVRCHETVKGCWPEISPRVFFGGPAAQQSSSPSTGFAAMHQLVDLP